MMIIRKKEAFLKIKEIKKVLNRLNKDYYEDDSSLVDDSFYDKKLKELVELENLYPDLIDKHSPTQIVGGKISSTFKKTKHSLPMLSLNNAFNNDDLIHFDKQINSMKEKYDYFVEPKIDGLSISIKYFQGKLVEAITRGDGLVGENVTENIKQIDGIPLEIKTKENLEVRGEIYMPLSVFEKINKQREQNEEKLFANPRNAASGTIRQLNPYVVKQRMLKLFVYWAHDYKTNERIWKTQNETIDELGKLEFSVSKESFQENSIENVIKRIKQIEKNRNMLDYEIDGIVIKINDSKLYKKIGQTSKFPKWAIAFKFPPKIVETLLKDIFPTVGRTGRITYNAKLEPVKIDGTIVKRATLHNSDYINNLDLRIGDFVEIKKAGEIIPKVISYNESRRKKTLIKWKENKICFDCKQNLFRYEGEVDQYCMNLDCPSRVIESLLHFCSRDAMNIEGLSVKQIQKFVNLNFIRDFSDIYLLKTKKDEIVQLDGYREKSVNSLLNSIEKTKSNTLDRLLFGLGIRHIGKKTSKDLAKTFGSLNDISNLSYEHLLTQMDLGEVKSKSIVDYFNNNENIKLLEKLKKLNIDPIQEKVTLNQNNKFFGKKIVITGTIKGGTRNYLISSFENLGAKVMSSISGSTDFLIVGENPSKNKISKINKDKIIVVLNINEL